MFPTKLQQRLQRNLAFACASNKTFDPKVVSKIKAYLDSIEAITDTTTTLGFEAGSVDGERMRLDAEEAACLNALFKKLHGDAAFKEIKEDRELLMPANLKGQLKTLADKLLKDKPQHVLVRLALEHATAYYRIEEIQTCSYVYFSKPEQAVSNYSSYKKDIEKGGGALVVLRVEIAKLTSPSQDPSDSTAIRTAFKVDSSLVMVMENHSSFANKEWRNDEKNWKPIAELSA